MSQIIIRGERINRVGLESQRTTPPEVLDSYGLIRIQTREYAVAIQDGIGQIHRTYTRIDAEVTLTTLLGIGSINLRVNEVRTLEDVHVLRNQRIVLIRIITTLETAPYSIMRHAVSHTYTVAVGSLVPLRAMNLKLDGGIVSQVVKPYKRVMHLATGRLQSDVTVVKSKGRIDDNHIVRYLSQVVVTYDDIIISREDRCTGIGVEQRVDDERRASTVVNTYGR